MLSWRFWSMSSCFFWVCITMVGMWVHQNSGWFIPRPNVGLCILEHVWDQKSNDWGGQKANPLWRGDDLNSYCRVPKCAQFYLAVSSLEQICWSRLSWDLDFQWCFHTSIIVNVSTCRFLVQSHASLHSWGCLMLGILWFATSHRSQSGLSKRWWDLD